MGRHMNGKTRWTISALTVAGLMLAVVAGETTSGATSQALKHSALAASQSVGFGINLDDCGVLAEPYHGGCASQLQAELNAVDNAGLTVDGVFGPTTRKAVIIFQQEHGVTPADGIVGPATKAALDAAASQPSPSAPTASSPAPPVTAQAPFKYVALVS
jgi:peptidoglycan hydrolase-like protein with peptidoglycan-binding domain